MIFESGSEIKGIVDGAGLGSILISTLMIGRIIIAERGSNGAGAGVFCCVSSLRSRWSEYATETGILDSDSIPLTV